VAAAKDTTCKFRLSSEQKAKIKQLAADRGLSEGELILQALGLEGDPEASSLPAAATPADRPDPKKEPGAAALLEVADRVQRKRRKKS
jgi:hypothetical protein